MKKSSMPNMSKAVDISSATAQLAWDGKRPSSSIGYNCQKIYSSESRPKTIYSQSEKNTSLFIHQAYYLQSFQRVYY